MTTPSPRSPSPRSTVDTVVIGGGAMGSSTAWALAQRGTEVLLLERFSPGHTEGASHGESRNFNVAYSDPTYIAMLAESQSGWRELEAQSGVAIFDQVGVANHGANPGYPQIEAALTASGIAAEMLPPGEAATRWPGIRFDGPVLYNADAGRLNANAAVAALQGAASAHGAVVQHGARATAIDVLGDNRVLVRYSTDAGEHEVVARHVVSTLGAWTTTLLGGHLALPRLVVTQEQPAHFPLLDDSFRWPGFNHTPNPDSADYDFWYSGVYGMHTPGEGIKAGWHGVGPVTDPDARTYSAEPTQLAALQRYVREWLPGADAENPLAISCTYTTTVDENFVLDRAGPLTVGAGFSGHGFKFTPAIGRILADLSDSSAPAPALFGLGSQRTAGGGPALAMLRSNSR